MFIMHSCTLKILIVYTQMIHRLVQYPYSCYLLFSMRSEYGSLYYAFNYYVMQRRHQYLHMKSYQIYITELHLFDLHVQIYILEKRSI